MAIDDNTTYGLTGAQVKELPEKINAVKGLAKILTTDDYNWNSTAGDDTTEPFDSIAYWKLPSGYYKVTSGVVIKIPSGGVSSSIRNMLVMTSEASSVAIISFYNAATIQRLYKDLTPGSYSSGQTKILTVGDIVDNLTSAISSAPLSARQGKVLNEKIQAISNYSTTEVDTGGTWIDGSTIYKKTVVIASLGTAGSTTAVAHGITNLSKIIKIEGVSQSGTNFTILPYADGGNNDIGVYVNSTNVCVYSQANRTGQSADVTIYYTKSS